MEKGETLLLSTIFCHLILDFYVKTRIRFSLRGKRLFEIIEVEITRSTVVKSVSYVRLVDGFVANQFSNYAMSFDASTFHQI